MYLAYAAALAAGLDGIRRGLEPPAPVEGFLYDLPEHEQGAALPTTFQEALEALGEDTVITAALGERLIETFNVVKAARARALPRVGHRLGVCGVRPATVTAHRSPSRGHGRAHHSH